jgi:hypothetical protein
VEMMDQGGAWGMNGEQKSWRARKAWDIWSWKMPSILRICICVKYDVYGDNGSLHGREMGSFAS